jgi:hypothetical protein
LFQLPLMSAGIPRLLLEESHMTYCRVNPQTSGSEIDYKVHQDGAPRVAECGSLYEVEANIDLMI